MTMWYAHPIPENKRRAVDVLTLVFNRTNQNQEYLQIEDVINYNITKK